MCAINPAHKKRFIINVYTSDKSIDKKFFDEHSTVILTEVEMELNIGTPFRWHLKESTEEAE